MHVILTNNKRKGFMKKARLLAVQYFVCVLSCLSLTTPLVRAQSGLQVSYGSKGVSRIVYNSVVLVDTALYPGDSFHIWHMKASDLSGNPITYGQYGWGESNNGESWDAASQTETYAFSWGSIATRFVQNGENLDMIVTEINNPGSGVLFDGAEVYPFAFHFPQDPKSFYGYNQFAITTTGPGVSQADFAAGIVTSVIPDESVPLYGGWKSAGSSTYTPLMTSTAPDGLPSFLPRNDVPVQPGSSFSYTVSLRFTPEGTAADAGDAYRSFAATYPSQMTWTDKRIIGTAYLASSPSSSQINQAGGFPTNPRRYFNDPSVDITTVRGLQAFQNRMLQQATTNTATARGLNGQGVITWDIEGEQYPQNTSYVCSPDQIGAVAPEMESTVLDPSSPYAGQKLDDAYFSTMSSAGLKIGLCLRPQQFTLHSDGTASQVYLNGNSAVIANLETKARYANARWGATIFYVDSTVDTTGGTLDPAIFQQLITDLPGFLFIPEESTPRYYAYSAPFYTFLFHTDLGTPANIYQVYPRAFGANLVNDVSAATLAAYTPQLTQSVAKGDILMGHADYWQSNDPTLVSIYAAAGTGAPTPVQVAPALTWSTPQPVTYGTPLSASQLNATANTNGIFVYSPALNTVLGAGTNTLTVTFTPLDMVNYKTVTATTTLIVAPAAPVLTWNAPAPIVSGTALSAAQLNAAANVPGTFTYQPSSGSFLGIGSNLLSVIFTPTDATNYTSAAASTTLVVTQVQQKTPSVFWNASFRVTYGTALSNAQLNASADVPGNFVYSPVYGTVLNAGTNLLRVTFTPSDSTSFSSVTTTTSLIVAQAVPVISWQSPQPISSGTGLSGTQLNAASNVPGSFTYTPGQGAILNSGTSALNTVFTPSDTANYIAQSASVMLTVNPPAAPDTHLAILYPGPGATVSGTLAVSGFVNLALDSAGTFLMVDGQEVGNRRLSNPPWLYEVDTTTLTNGQHVLQIWGHDIGNNTTISAGVLINVLN